MSYQPELYDFTGDPNLDYLVDLYKHGEVPEVVKAASSEGLRDLDELPDHAFAWPSQRAFPVHTKAATMVSAIYFRRNRDQIPRQEAETVGRTLRKFANRHGVAATCDEILDAPEKTAEVAGDDDCWLIAENGEGQRASYPVQTVDAVHKAAGWMMRHRSNIPFNQRHTMAQRLLKQAARLGAEIDNEIREALLKTAGYGLPAVSRTVTELKKRAAMIRGRNTQQTALREKAASVADCLSKSPTLLLDHAACVKLAETIDSIDRHTMLSHNYGRGISLPEDYCFGLTHEARKTAVDNSCETPTGSIYCVSQFKKLAVQDLRDLGGDGLVRRCCNESGVDPVKVAHELEVADIRLATAMDTRMAKLGEAAEVFAPNASVDDEASRADKQAAVHEYLASS